ncbi:MAG: hypothetical protein D6689_20125 [Deltaproteobacteria bacterium]|nr:MAG: hypothetical protein D6689_20125 [Deltaproteobacteria bacterium]
MGTRALFGAAGGLALAGAGLLGWYAAAGGAAQAADTRTRPAATEADVAVAPEGPSPDVLGRTVTLAFEDRRVPVRWSELASVGEAGQVAIDDARAVAKLTELKAQLDRPPQNARMDLERRQLVPDRPGAGVDVYGALARLRLALVDGRAEVTLPAIPIRADVTTDDLGRIDISHVLGHFTTRFSVAEKRRSDNLKLAASKLDGYVLMPGAEFSFNDVVGPRTEAEGYKIAHVITSGEMVDGLAGGSCQISTTLHGAAFFAGLDILKSTPHSRPSTYVTMGLDATVVYPVTDLKLRNPYDFPVVIHYRVARGEATVEILGKKRPYDRIEFEREILEELPFDTVTREDDTLPVGSLVVEQEGFPGYKLKRYRRFYRGGKVVKTDKWTLWYRPVTEYTRMGTNPNPNLPWPKPPKAHGPRAPKGEKFRLVQ